MPAPTLRDILPPSPEQLQQQLIGDNQLYRGFATGIKGVTSGSLANDALNAESNGATNAATLRDQALASQQAAAAYAPRVGSLRNIHGVGDAVDYGLGAVGQGVASMAPTIAAAALARAPVFGPAAAKLTSYAGAAGAGYLQEKGEAALGQYSDPTLAAAPVAERQRAATTKGLVNAALEGIVPAGLTSAVGKNGVGRILAKDFVTEGATEAAQQYVGHLADKSLDATRQLDPWDIADAFAGGALTGGAVGAVHGVANKLSSAPKDFVTSTRAAIEDAGANAPTPTDFLKSVFKPGPSVDLDPVAAGDAHPDLVDAVSKAGDRAGEVLDGLTAKRGEMAASYAEELLQDPDVPAAVKQTIMDMGGDYESPQNQAALGATYVGRKAGEVASSAADFVKGLAPKAAEAAKGFVSGVQDRVVKKNLQGGPVTEDETFALHKDIIDNLKPEAKRRTDIIADLPQLAAGIAGVLNKYGAVKTAPTDKNIQELQHLYSAATTLFDNPEAVFTKLASKVEATRADGKKPTPFSDLLAGVTTAQQDVGKNEGSSYLQTRLVAPMGPAEVKQLARFVDEFGMTDYGSTKRADKVLDGLAVAFGGKQEALQVLDYYSRANRLNAKQLLQYDANTQLDAEDGKVLSADDIQDNPEDFNSGIREYDATPTKTYSFADPKTNRPFRAAERLARKDAASLRQGTVASDSAKVTTVPYSQYADETGKDHKAEVVRIMNDVKARQDKAYAGYAAELGLKGTAEAKLAAARNYALERRPSPDKASTRLADIDRLQGELDMARAAYKEGGPKATLDLYEVNAAEQNEKDDLTATDEDLKAMATNKNDEDMVSFTKADGKKMTLSSKSMARTQAAKEKATGQAARGEGSTTREARLLKEAIASVLAREDIKGMDEKSTPPVLKPFPRSDDTKAALAEQEESVAALKKRLDAAVRDYEDGGHEAEARDDVRVDAAVGKLNTQREAFQGPGMDGMQAAIDRKEARVLREASLSSGRDIIRTSIERNISRLQSQYEAAEGSAPRRAVIRQRQAVYKEALAAINDVDFQEKLEKDWPDMATERTEPTGARVFEEDVGTFVGDEKRGSETARYAEKYGPSLAAPDTPKSKEQVEREKKNAEERDKAAFTKLKEGTPVGEDRIFKKSLQGTGAPSDKLIDAVADVVLKENYARLDAPEKVLAFARAAKQVLSHLQGLSFDQYEALGEDRTRTLMVLRDQLEENLAVNGTFDWDMMWDGQDPTDAQRAELGRIIGGNSVEPKAILPQKSSYAAKDQAKWDKADKFIGRGSKYSSTNAYAQAIGPTRANTGNYEASDVVFVSAEGARTGRISPDFVELKKATDAGATIVADNIYNRERSYNVGEREVAAFLVRQGYREKFGVWTKQETQSKQDARTDHGSNPDAAQQEALDEIARIRGKGVAVAFARMAQIKGSGDFSMNKDKTDRLIRLAVDGANMKSTAWHESLHDFIAMLGGTPQERALKRDMLNATNTPYINAKLRELLKDHPAALKQLSDPEERLAYVYQFWAEGALKLTPAADTLLAKIAEFIQNLLGIVSQDGKLDAQLAALHRGELTEPSTVARVLDNLDAKTVRDKLEGLTGPLGEGLSRVFTSATDRLRKPGLESLYKLAGLFHKDPGNEVGSGGMLQRRAQKEGQFSNAYQKLVEGTTAAERLNALNNLQAMKTPQGPLELGLTKLLDDMYNYMTEAGVATFNKDTKKWVPVRRVANYFPRSWDGESIRKDVAGFKALLVANGVSMQQADATIDMLTKSGNGQFDLVENDKALGFVPLAVHVNDRVFTFITPTNAAMFAKYQNKDVTDIMTTYIRQASHRGEYARSFGNNGEVIEELLKKAREEGMTHAEEASILPTIRGLEGTLGYDMNPAMKKIMSGVITLENVVLMPMAIFSQMVDPIGIAMRTNSVKDAGAAYLQSLKDLKKAITRDNSRDYDRELTKMLGIISTDSMLETMGQTQGSMYMTSTMRHINQKFFRYNGMEGWNNSMRVAATVAGERYLLANVGNERAMTELNVDPKNIKVMPEGTNWGEGGRMAITKEQFEHLGMSKDEAQAAAEQIQEAMFRFVDGAVVRPNAAHRATWMSDPRFQLLSHLKQFTFSFQSAVLNRARNEYIHGNSTPMLLLSMTVPIMLAADIAKWAMTGTMPANWTALDYMTHAVVRSGILGKYEYAARSIEDAARGNVPGLSFAGPTVEHANILAQWIAGAPGASSDRVVDRTIPLARYA